MAWPEPHPDDALPSGPPSAGADGPAGQRGWPDKWPTPDQQMRSARDAYRRYAEAPMKRRVAEREALVQQRAEHRASKGYPELAERYERLLDVYCDDRFFDKFAREYFTAGTSRVTPKRVGERSWVLDVIERMAERREEIIEVACNLDGIDSSGEFDSAAPYDYRRPGPPPEDNHVNRAWQTMLRSDVRQLTGIIALRKPTWVSWLRRVALGAVLPGICIALGTWSTLATGVSIWSASSWVATVLSLIVALRLRAAQKSSFVVAVC